MTVDAEGHLWVAIYGGSAVHRYSPHGEQEAVVHLPVTQVTSCAFGGETLEDLYVTTARENFFRGAGTSRAARWQPVLLPAWD